MPSRDPQILKYVSTGIIAKLSATGRRREPCRLGHADHLERAAVELDRLADRVDVGEEGVLKVVADEGHVDVLGVLASVK